jgi:hypothetical protein
MAGRLDVDLFDVLDCGEGRAGRQIVFEGFNAFERAFGQCFDSPVGEISHVAQNLMAGGSALREEAVADALHSSANQKFSRDYHHHPLFQSSQTHHSKNATENSIEQWAVSSEEQER